ncbi:Major facilitator superfamily domain general substrate transporter [Penicillium taxi]|uniref:Major facilitator superfamily domain general substrate transporter n=1 Tax=Penicillium taxi TaxID=168475 RepID=UPI002544D32E|nr:Major facilitator superfamily domain general substrate transporter [Penicillium taxi]KAJ5887596.1 Major facilitator superfamily domain general substrate transporter [Penicillium taxi]
MSAASAVNGTLAELKMDNRNINDRKGPKNAPIVIFCISCTTFFSSYLGGLATMYTLATGCTLLISGALSDAVGNRVLFLAGCFLLSIFSMASGLARSGTELIIFRAISDVAASLCLPSAMCIITEQFLTGKLRNNIALALMGSGQPIGFEVGLVFGGIFADTLWQLPRNNEGQEGVWWTRIVFGIDWAGAFIISPALALLSYALAIITDDVSNINEAVTIVLLCLFGVLILGFVLWEGRQERHSKPTLIKNSLWKQAAFTCISVIVFMIWGSFNAFEQVVNFFFQDVQGLSVLNTSVRFIPVSVVGFVVSVITGMILHRVRADILISIATVISSLSPLLMALVNPSWTYWRCVFFAMCMNPVAADVLFTVSNLIVAGMFPAETQGLASGVFNTVSQFGRTIGLALVALISNSITERTSSAEDRQSPEALLSGYLAAFWFLFAMNVTSLVIGLSGLRKVGNVGERKHL